MRFLRQMLKQSIKRACGTASPWKYLSRFSKAPQVIVLGFHDVCEDRALSSWLRMPKNRFVSLLADLKKDCRFIRPEDLFCRGTLSRSRLNLLVTFDDGYANNRRIAMPVLQSFDIPSLFFVSSANVQRQSLFWFDRLIIPIQALNLRSLNLSALGLNHYEFASANDGLNRWDTIQRLLVDVKALGNPDDTPVQKVLAYFDTHFQTEIDAWADDFRPMTDRELGELAGESLFTLGSHSHHHQILTRLTPEDLVYNLERSKQALEAITHQNIDHFAPPNGDANDAVRAQIRKAGYRFVYNVKAGKVSQRTDPLDIPRLLIGGYDDAQEIRWKLATTVLALQGFKKG